MSLRVGSSVVAFASFVGLAILAAVAGGEPLPIDLEAARAARPLATSSMAALLAASDWIGSLPVWVALVVGAAGVLWLRDRRHAALLVLLVLTADPLAGLVKLVVERPRPPGGEVAGFLTDVSFAYPSGHTVRAVVTSGVMGYLVAAARGRRVALSAALFVIAVSLLMGLARVASGQHWLTDVVGGYLLGVAWLCVAVPLWRAAAARGARSPAS